jgi:hypothetical protein
MTTATIGLSHTEIGPKTLYDELDYWVDPTMIRPKSIYDDSNH